MRGREYFVVAHAEDARRVVDFRKQQAGFIDVARSGIFREDVFVCSEARTGDFAVGIVVGTYCDGIDIIAFEHIPIARQVVYAMLVGECWPSFWISRSNGNEFKAVCLGKTLGVMIRHTT